MDYFILHALMIFSIETTILGVSYSPRTTMADTNKGFPHSSQTRCKWYSK